MEIEFTPEQLISKWEKFFESKIIKSGTNYMGKISELADAYPDTRSLYVDYWDIDFFDNDLADYYLERPYVALYNAEQAIINLLPSDIIDDNPNINITVRIKNIDRMNALIQVRDLRHEHLAKAIAISGLVRRITEVNPRISKAYYQCRRCYTPIVKPLERFYLDEPFECEKEQGGCGRAAASTAFKLLDGQIVAGKYFKSEMVDTQKIEIQEHSEDLPPNVQPLRKTIYLDDDITGRVFPGDKVVITGTHLSVLRQLKNRKISATLGTYFEANSVEIEEKGYEDIDISQTEVENIIKFSKQPHIHEMITQSIAPSIFGMDIEKEAIALMLFSGTPKTMEDGIRIRGDPHILLVGDPGVAKSQLLAYIAQLAPHAVQASGKSSSAAGLTASAIKDEFGEGAWTIEAGAMVLADGGVACIDEMDKMNPTDRSAIHEAMEQQEINVAKAGLIAKMKSRCSVFAAANPKYGRFDEYRPISDQIDLPPALLSRFDVIFPVKDKPDKAKDLAMAEHILKMHSGDKAATPQLNKDFLRKYIALARANYKPRLTIEAINNLASFYVRIRDQSGQGEKPAVAITPRQLESMERLAEASAKMRLSNEVNIEDTERAIRITEYYLRRVASDSGILDIDMIATGTGHSQRGRIIALTSVIDMLTKDSRTGSANRDDIVTEMESQGFEKDQILADIEKLLREGKIFCPTENKVRLV